MSEAEDVRLLDSLLNLELPIARTHESAAATALGALARARRLTIEDYTSRLEDEAQDWALGGTVTPVLREAIGVALRARDGSGNAAASAAWYFGLYDKLRQGGKDWASLHHASAVRLISKTNLTSMLLTTQNYSCSQVARVFGATESSLRVSYQAIAAVARSIESVPELSSSEVVDALHAADRSRSETLFPDASLGESCEIVARRFEAWGQTSTIRHTLAALVGLGRRGVEPFQPYLQILHWCSLPVEFFDHPASYLYEFSPRGKIALSLFSKYPAATGNPVLNNAKATVRLDRTWAQNRGGEDAASLVSLLEALENLPWAARRQAARVIRAWLLRVIDLLDQAFRPVPDGLSLEQIRKISSALAETPSRTRGVLEQRFTDVLAVLALSGPGWRPIGLGDGVNASNLSKKKLGDVEFMHVENRESIALETHGGHLTGAYVIEHHRSLARVLRVRLDESWLLIDEAANWTVKVLFVAHSRDRDLPGEAEIHGVHVRFEYLNYHEFLESAYSRTLPWDEIKTFHTYMVDALNVSTVRQSARDVVLSILEA